MANKKASDPIESILQNAFRAEGTTEKLRRTFSEDGQRWVKMADVTAITTAVFENDFQLEIHPIEQKRRPTINSVARFAYAERKADDVFEIFAIKRDQHIDEGYSGHSNEERTSVGLYHLQETLKKLAELEEEYRKDAQLERPRSLAPGNRLPLPLANELAWSHVGSHFGILRAKLQHS